MKDFLLKLIHRHHLTRLEARIAFEAIMNGQASDAQIGALLMGLASKGVHLEELIGAHGVMRERVVAVPRGEDEVILDTCGTGGDVKGTFNISTTAALLVAACGVKVVKHGNRSASSTSGSADVLEKLGVKLDIPPERLRECLDHAGICFAFARNHHPAMKHVAAARSAMGVPTIFNLLGPLTNPAQAHYQLLGVYSDHLTELLAGVLKEAGSRRAWVVHAEDGLDELSTMSTTHVCELNQGTISHWTLDPQSLGINRPQLHDLQVTSVEQSAAMVVSVLDGEKSAARDIAGLNAAAGLVIAGAVDTLAQGLRAVDQAVLSGAARNTLSRLASFG
jgi:anthranilate phosphoribosyltransferase